MADFAIELDIIRPQDNTTLAANQLPVEVRVLLDKKHGHKKHALLALARWEFDLLLDGKVVGLAEQKAGNLISFTAKIDLRKQGDGVHTLQAVLYKENAHRKQARRIESEITHFILDRTPPVIHSVYPSGGLRIVQGNLPAIVVEADDSPAGLDLEHCAAMLDGVSLGPASFQKKGLIFRVDKVSVGSHQLQLRVQDRAGNLRKFKSSFEVLAAQPKKDKREHQREAEAFRARLDSDLALQKQLLTSPRQTLVELGLPYTRTLASLLPPPLPEAQADFFAKTDAGQAQKALAPLKQRVLGALDQRDNERIARALQRLGLTDLVETGGSLSAGAKKTIASILQDPAGMLEQFGVSPTTDEQEFIFPAFPPVVAEAMAEWFSTLNSGKPPTPAGDKKTALDVATQAAQNNLEKQIAWLTDPAAAFGQAYPAASAMDLANLPAPILAEEARRLLSPLPNDGALPDPVLHNSSDAVVAISIETLNKLVAYYFSTEAPGLLPVQSSGQYQVDLPAPYDQISYDIYIAQPGDLRVVDLATNSMSLTATGQAGITLSDGTRYSYGMSLTPHYHIQVHSDHIELVFQSIDVIVADQEADVPVPLAAAQIKTAIQTLVQALYPGGIIPLFDQPLLNITLPFADVAVVLERIYVYDDQDPDGSGELYFEVNIADDKYLLGQFDADSGSSIELNRRFLLMRSGSPFTVGIRGIDLDAGIWPDTDDYLGENSMLNACPTGPEHYSLSVRTDVIEYEMVWQFLEAVTEFMVRLLCWVVEFFVSIVNACGKLLGFEHRIETRCTEVLVPMVREVWGWVEKANTRNVASYILEYSIMPLPPVSATLNLVSFETSTQAIYLAFDFPIPGIDDLAARSSARGFLGAASLGTSVSENLVNKIVRSFWKYAPLPRLVTTSFDSRAFHATLDIGAPNLLLEKVANNPHFQGSFQGRGNEYLAAVNIHVDQGIAGTNLGPIHISVPTPTDVLAYASLNREEGTMLSMMLEKIWFLGNNVPTLFLNLAASFYNLFGWFTGKKAVLIDSLVQLSHNGGMFQVQPHGPIEITNDEILVNFDVTISPVLVIQPISLNFSATAQQFLEIRNTGNMALTLTGLRTDSPFFSVQSLANPQVRIAPNQQQIVPLMFTPSAIDTYEGNLIIDSDDPTHPVLSVPLSASAAPRVEVQPAELKVVVSGENWEHPTPKTVTIRNIGNLPLIITEISTDGDRAVLSMPWSLPLSLQPGEAGNIQVMYNPQASSTAPGRLIVKTNDPSRLVSLVEFVYDNTLVIANKRKSSLELHLPQCQYAKQMSYQNIEVIVADLDEIIAFNQNHVLPAILKQRIEEQDYDGCYFCMNWLHTK